jgi:hypothetical protein
MPIEVGGTFGVCLVWRDKTARWDDDCVGAKKKQGPQVMCWGIIVWNFKSPFHLWEKDTKQEKQAATREIAELNKTITDEADRLNAEWKTTEEWQQLRQYELKATAQQCTAEKNGAPKAKISQTYRHTKYKVQKLKRGDAKGIDSWQYVKHIARPLLWPTCKYRQENNTGFLLMEDNSPYHDSNFTNYYRLKDGIPKLDWPLNSPDFNSIEHIWTLIKSHIQKRRDSERITTISEMMLVLVE